MEQKRAQYKEFLDAFGHLPSRVAVLDPEDSLVQLAHFVKDPKKTVVACDFDQTLTLGVPSEDKPGSKTFVVRGGDETIEFLQKMKDEGAYMVVITAQSPGIEVMKNMANELRRFGLGETFGVEPFTSHGQLYKLFRNWGDNTSLTARQLTKKLLALIVVNTDRLAGDLARLGASTVSFSESGKEVSYRLVHPKNKDDWGAKLVLCSAEESDVCPVETWKSYMDRTARFRSDTTEMEGGSEIQQADRTFLALLSELEFSADTMDEETLVELTEEVLREAAVPECQKNTLLKQQVALLQTKDKIKIARMGNTMAARYNKAEDTAALHWIMEREEMDAERVVFVDDNSDNVFNVYLSFAQHQRTNPKANSPSAFSCWYPPPTEGRDETYEEAYRDMLLLLAEDHAKVL